MRRQDDHEAGPHREANADRLPGDRVSNDEDEYTDCGEGKRITRELFFNLNHCQTVLFCAAEPLTTVKIDNANNSPVLALRLPRSEEQAENDR